MLGSIDTGGFEKQKDGKSLLDAMRDSNYFKREGVEGVYGPKDTKAPISSGSPELDKKFEKNPKNFFKGDSKGFLDNVLEGGLDYFKKSQGEKSDADKLIDFAKSQQKAAQFGDFGSGAFKEVAEGLTYGQLPSQTQQMFIPGQQAQGKSLGQRFAGAASGLMTGLSTGIPHAGGIGAIGGFFA